MARIFKDKKAIYGGPLRSHINSREKNLSRRFDHYKQFGPAEPRTYHCHYCGRHTEFEGGYLVCNDCGGVDLAFSDLLFDPVAA